ncbi:MAG TPA: hypothetical protein VI874_03865 [Candidatus Norongarragalinales archaeon]|nr:hypothetical protein [Candidatus Norongarragalinales archaeon]
MLERTRPVKKDRFSTYLRKAEEFFIEMKHAESEARWNAASLNGIHCVISSADALSVAFLGLRSAGQRHENAEQLIRKTGVPGCDEKAKQFLQVTNWKTLVEYSDEEPSEKDARRMVLQSERFFSWVKSVFAPSHK